jgi:hypothetical protein
MPEAGGLTGIKMADPFPICFTRPPVFYPSSGGSICATTTFTS